MDWVNVFICDDCIDTASTMGENDDESGEEEAKKEEDDGEEPNPKQLKLTLEEKEEEADRLLPDFYKKHTDEEALDFLIDLAGFKDWDGVRLAYLRNLL